MTRQSAPHSTANAPERQQSAKNAKKNLDAAMAAEAARIKGDSPTVVSPHVLAAKLGASKAVITLALQRAIAADKGRAVDAATAGRDAPAARAAGGASPTSNTGGKVRNVQLVTTGRQTKIVAVRDTSTTGQCAMIDTLSVVFHKSTLEALVPNNPSRDGGTDEHFDDYMLGFSEVFMSLFGFAITRRLSGKGRNFYQYSYEIGDRLGHIGIGGNQDTVQIHLDGKGCLQARDGWETRLHDWLVKYAVDPRITRVDLAHDDFEGETTVDHMFAAYHHGAFTNGGRPPRCELKGDWIMPDGQGRTLYVGSRENGLLYRGYEKGREQGDESSPWVRHEVQLGNKCRVIPLNVLIFPGQYFAGTYDALAPFTEKQVRIHTEKKQVEASFKHVVEVAKNQVGRAVNLMLDTLKDPAKVVEALIRDGYPKAFQVYTADHTAPIVPAVGMSDAVFFDHGAATTKPAISTGQGRIKLPDHQTEDDIFPISDDTTRYLTRKFGAPI